MVTVSGESSGCVPGSARRSMFLVLLRRSTFFSRSIAAVRCVHVERLRLQPLAHGAFSPTCRLRRAVRLAVEHVRSGVLLLRPQADRLERAPDDVSSQSDRRGRSDSGSSASSARCSGTSTICTWSCGIPAARWHRHLRSPALRQLGPIRVAAVHRRGRTGRRDRVTGGTACWTACRTSRSADGTPTAFARPISTPRSSAFAARRC